MASVRARNESAWLLPNDGTRTNHQLRADMRRFADDDEVDLVDRRRRRRRLDAAPAAGPGAAGGSAALDAGPFWDPDTDWVSDEAGSHHLYWTEPRVIARRRPGADGLQQLRPRRRRLHGPLRRLHPALPPQRLHDPRPGRRGRGLADRYADLRPYYDAHRGRNCPWPGEDWPWGDPHRYPHQPHPVGGNGEVFLRGARALGITAKVGPVAIPNGRFGNRPHCIYRGFCLQGCKVNAKASPLITHIPDALAHGAEVRADCHGHPHRRRRAHRPGHRRALRPRRGASGSSGPRWSRSPGTPSRRRGCCCCRPASGSPTGWATTSTRSGGT